MLVKEKIYPDSEAARPLSPGRAGAEESPPCQHVAIPAYARWRTRATIRPQLNVARPRAAKIVAALPSNGNLTADQVRFQHKDSWLAGGSHFGG